MPAYGTFATPTAIYVGDSSTVWNNESPIAGAASERVAIGNLNNLSVQVLFAAAPGGFEIDVQIADIDQDQYYSTVPTSGVITAVTGKNAAVAQVPVKAMFARLLMKSAATASVTASIASGMGGF